MQPTSKSIYKRIFILTLFISVFFHCQSYSQTTNILDSNFEQALVNLNIDTNGLNGNILNSDADSVLNLDVSENFIQNLTGIEAFSNLKTLDCSKNNLNSIDISNNIQLEELNANDNQLNTINVSSNVKLELLSLSSNQLTTINLYNNPYLENLSVDLNNLISLDVTNNLQLEYLGCYSNNLSVIDLTNNTLLKHVFINFNNLSNLDLSQNTILRTLSCSSNNFTELNLLNNSDLNYFDCRDNNLTDLDLSNNSNLKRLFFSNNHLTEIDLTNLSDLLLIFASDNNISTLDISNNLDLRWIKFDKNNLSSVDFRNGNNSHISEFTMTENSNLNCIFVDDAEASYLETWLIDDASAFVENESDCEALTVEEEPKFGFNMFPNPATNMVSVTIDTQLASLDIYSIKGQVIISQPLSFGKNNIQLEALSSGMYLVKITSANQSETNKLLIH
ncbi:T9SS type A sorting domain-containing protein [Xanthomarina spongicola]|uniref:Putative secreted protein (Por secretion system target) n=1 Tax=Xanthomarina spongicola TaxID=570520 RepID=A0A316DR43_9FLAO|nr:T9SS type A sorting domain-containing protein [Xanthomarina spongicola]PWK19922.1 putative secreted protein (Por secretion system target) [Xanthomarina spongicola]